jgi:hypothetical protein
LSSAEEQQDSRKDISKVETYLSKREEELKAKYRLTTDA